MDLKKALEIEREDFGERMEIRIKKGRDYATDDVLSNFKRMAKLMEILSVDITKPTGTALYNIVHKIDRLCNILNRKNGEVKNESIKDTILDMQNYIDLLKEILIEQEVK